MIKFNEFLDDVKARQLEPGLGFRERPDLHATHVSDFIRQAKREVLQVIRQHYDIIKKYEAVDRLTLEHLIAELKRILNDPAHAKNRVWQQ